MHVDVEYRLTTVSIAVHHQPVTRGGDAFLLGDLLCRQQHLPHETRVFRWHIVKGANMLARHYQDVHWRLGVDVAECDQGRRLQHHVGLDLAGHHLAEEAIWHGSVPHFGTANTSKCSRPVSTCSSSGGGLKA